MRIESAHGGENWSPRDTSFQQDMPDFWGDWGVSSECGGLRAVLLRRPGPEIEGITNADSVQWLELCDPELVRQQVVENPYEFARKTEANLESCLGKGVWNANIHCDCMRCYRRVVVVD